MSAALDKLRVALVGCGRIGAHTPPHVRAACPPGWLPLNHAEAITTTPGLELVAVCDTDAARAEATAKEFGAARWFTDYRKLIEETQPDLLSIATRTDGRCDIVEFAAVHGVRGIHAEKPLGRSREECQRALFAIATHGVKFSYGTTRRYMDAYREAKRLFTEGGFGALQQVTLDFGHSALLWTHPHSVDLAIFLSGASEAEFVQATCAIPPEAVQGRVVDADPKVEGALIQFANGVRATITCAGGLHAHLAGEHGTLSVGADGSWLEWNHKATSDAAYPLAHERRLASASLSGTQRVFQSLADAIRNGTTTGIAPEEVALGCDLLLAMVWSSLQGGRRVSLAEVPADLTVTGRAGELFA